ncbi:hypothetical protein [Myxosarcina sp. GI1(2024)]
MSNANLAVSCCLDSASPTVRAKLTNSPTTSNSKKATAKIVNKQQQYFSQPNLWWAVEQFDPFGGRLVESWTSHARVKEINLTVNLQLWTLMDYLGRYSFVNQFGTTVRNQGYNLSIFSTRKQRLATYKYNPKTEPPKWEITLERLGKDSLRVNSLNN